MIDKNLKISAPKGKGLTAGQAMARRIGSSTGYMVGGVAKKIGAAILGSAAKRKADYMKGEQRYMAPKEMRNEELEKKIKREGGI